MAQAVKKVSLAKPKSSAKAPTKRAPKVKLASAPKESKQRNLGLQQEDMDWLQQAADENRITKVDMFRRMMKIYDVVRKAERSKKSLAILDADGEIETKVIVL